MPISGQAISNKMPMIMRPGQPAPRPRDYVILSGTDDQGRTPKKLHVGEQCVSVVDENGQFMARGLSLGNNAGTTRCKLVFTNDEEIEIDVSVLSVC